MTIVSFSSLQGWVVEWGVDGARQDESINCGRPLNDAIVLLMVAAK